MSKPPMTAADVKATNNALREKHDAEETLLRAFRERKSKEKIDNAIRKSNQANERYHSLVAKFFQDYPA